MASLLLDGNGRVCIGCGSHILLADSYTRLQAGGDSGSVLDLGVAGPESCRLVCYAVSSSTVAVCNERKQLTVWDMTTAPPTRGCERVLNRKASKIVFTQDSREVVVADKNGDVHKYPVAGEDGGGGGGKVGEAGGGHTDNNSNLVLGHLSMLLDVQLSPCGQYILTADRDEKIRVSRFPNAYNIHTYCLGHTDFVTSISCLAGREPLLLSGSGDGTVRIWNYLDGREVGRREVGKDTEKTLTPQQQTDTEQAGSEQPAVVKVKAFHPAVTDAAVLAGSQGQFIAQVEGFNGLLLYSWSCAGPSTSEDTASSGQTCLIEKCAAVQLPDSLIDFDVHRDEVVVLAKACATGSILVSAYSLNGGVTPPQLVAKPGPVDLASRWPGLAASVAGWASGEEGAGEAGEGTGLRNLQKRWFDNMAEYLERKKARIEAERERKERALLVPAS